MHEEAGEKLKIFRKREPLTSYQTAAKRGLLINMQAKPYAAFNRFLSISKPLWMTHAAFKDFVLIPHEKGHLHVQKEARWAVVLASLHNVPREGNPVELVYDVQIFRLSGFNQYKPIKVVSIDEEQGGGLLFMLPGEESPVSV